MNNQYDEIISDEIHLFDTQGNYHEKVDGQYYIGVYIQYEHILELTLSPTTLFHFQFNDIIEYCNDYRICEPNDSNTSVDILKVIITEDDVYHVVIKTFWIRLVQRTWKRIYAERCRIINKRKHMTSLQQTQIHGKYCSGLNYLPGITGMLSSI
jgi:hypothetical protein